MILQGKTQTEDYEEAKILNNHYCSVFLTDNGLIPNILGARGYDIHFTKNGIIKLLKDLEPKKASGPNKITSRFWKECAAEIADALVLIFNASMKQGKIPEDWKKGIITPIYKGGNKPRSNAKS